MKGWKAELAWLADLLRKVYAHKWSAVNCRSSAGQGKFAGQRPAFYCSTTLPASASAWDDWHTKLVGNYSNQITCKVKWTTEDTGYRPFHTRSYQRSLQSLTDHWQSQKLDVNLTPHHCREPHLQHHPRTCPSTESSVTSAHNITSQKVWLCGHTEPVIIILHFKSDSQIKTSYN